MVIVLFIALEQNLEKERKKQHSANIKKLTALTIINEKANNLEDRRNIRNNIKNMSPDDIRKIQLSYPNLSTWQIFKATKEGKFLGLSDFGHLCQAELVCSDGHCQAQKNRFGGNDFVKILF